MSEKRLTMASLFSGSGGFELAGLLAGIEPVWASEIEPFPILVTTKRFPNMKHYGDVSKIDGSKVPPVDIITFGSPCQDLSIAGKRAGLEDGERSNLFYQAVRIIKEMRKETNGKYPRYAVWENVPGAYSSNNGDDFRSVLETLARVNDGTVSIPKTVWGGQGLILGDGYSICWRTLDAQYWGVPQRRKRIFLVADFDGWRAEKILFKSEGMSRYSAQSFRTWQRLANGSEGCTGEPSAFVMVENHPADSRVQINKDGKCQTLDARMGMGGGNTPLVMEYDNTPKTLKVRSGKEGGGKGALVQDNQSATLGCNNDQTLFVPFVKTSRAKSPEEISTFEQKEVANTLNTFDIGETRCNEMIVAIEGNGARPSHKGNGYSEDDKSFTLNTIEQHAVAYDSEKVYSMTCGDYMQCGEEKANSLLARDFKDPQIINEKKPNGVMQAEVIGVDGYNQCTTGDKSKPLTNAATDSDHVPCVMNTNYIVRRLTPTECARLQGFPDWWAHDLGTKHITEEDIKFWTDVWNTWCDINNLHHKKENAIRSWLHDPYSDAAEYKMWGNGVALPCVTFVLAGIEWADRTKQEGEEPVYDRQISIFDMFSEGAMYKGMKVNKEYTPEELGL